MNTIIPDVNDKNNKDQGFRIDDEYDVAATMPRSRAEVRPGQSLNDKYRRAYGNDVSSASAVTSSSRPARPQSPVHPQPPRPQQARPAQPQPARTKVSTDGYGGYNSGAPQDNPRRDNSDKTKRKLLIIIAILLVLLIGCGVGFAVWMSITNQKVEAERQAREAAELTLQQDLASSEFENLEQEFSGIENPRQMIATDSVKLRLTEKYEAARLEVEKLQRELKNSKEKSAAEIADLRRQIATLRSLLKHYIEEIDRLNKENEALRTENAEIKDRNQQLTTQVEQTTRENKQLSDRMTLAEKLNVTGVSLNALNGKGKTEKKVAKAKQLMVNFTIPQNNSTPVGEKTIYLRITTPEGQLLGGGGSFSFEGASLAASAKKVIEYGGQEIGGIKMYYDVRTALNPGTYTVELFADNYRLCSRQFTLR